MAKRIYWLTLILMGVILVGAGGTMHAAVGDHTAPSLPDAPTTATPSVSYFPLIYQARFYCLEMPSLLSPPDGAELDTIHPTFRWDGGDPVHAQGLNMEFSADPQFNGLYMSMNSGAIRGVHEYVPPSNFDEGVVYYWRARFRCTDGRYGPFTTPWSFTAGTGGGILPPPALVSPADGAVVENRRVTFTWQPVPGASHYKLSYQREGHGSTYRWVEGTSLTVTLQANATYRWRVAAVNDYAIGELSETWRLTTPAQ